MADAPNTLATANGLVKVKYADKIKDAVPPGIKFSSRLKFSKAQQIGKKFHQPVELSLPQGMTYAAAGAGAFDLEDAEPGQMDNAEVDGNQFMFVDCLDLESAAKAQSAGEEAFESAVGRVVKRMLKAASKRVELSFLYGGSSLGQVEAPTGVTYTSGTTGYVTISAATWASGIWIGMKNAKVDFYTNSGGLPSSTRLNSNTTLSLKITSVDVANRRLYLSGDAADLSAINGDEANSPHILFRNAKGKEMTGLDRIATNATDLHEIDGSSAGYELWAGNSSSNSDAELTLRRLYTHMSLPISKGLDEDVEVYLNPATMGNLLSSEVALRRYVEATGQAKNGFRSLKFEGQHGYMEFIPYINIKQGECFVGPTGSMKKIGASDLTMQVPGREKDEFFKLMEKKAGYELRMYANLALFCEAPANWLKITNIVNS